jgi:glycosyltransferase involved in cell wall biosynthesis
MCRTLSAHGGDSLIATTNADGEGRLAVPLGERTHWEGVPAIFFERRFSESYKYSPSLAAWLDASVSDFNVVHIHALLSHACLSAAAACVRHGVPYIVRPLGTLVPWSLSQRAWKKRLLLAVKGRAVLEGAVTIHYTSAAEKRLVEAALGLTRGVVVPLGIDPDLFDLRVSLPERERDRYVLAMSRIHPKKNLEALIEAFADCAGDRDGWRLVIAGDGDADYVRMLHRLVDDRRSAARVTFAGWVDGHAKLELVRGASVFALCSKHENFGLAVLEGMALGVPALVSREVDLASDIEGAGAGWVVENLHTSLRAHLRDAMMQAETRETRSRAARALAKRFGWPEIGRRLNEMYADALECAV